MRVDRDVSACVSVCADRGCEREKSPSGGWTWHRKEPRIHVTDGPRGEEGTCCVSSCFRLHISLTQGTHTLSDGLSLPRVCNATLPGRKDAHTPGERGDDGRREKEEGKGRRSRALILGRWLCGCWAGRHGFRISGGCRCAHVLREGARGPQHRFPLFATSQTFHNHVEKTGTVAGR